MCACVGSLRERLLLNLCDFFVVVFVVFSPGETVVENQIEKGVPRVEKAKIMNM